MYNKFITKQGEVLLDLTEDTVEPSTLLEGTTAHDRSGNVVIGTMPSKFSSDNIIHGDENTSLSNIIENYILTIDYDTILAFDTSEIVFGNVSTTSILGQAILG